MTSDYYLKISQAPDLQDPRERFLYRFFEILPGFLSWATFASAILASWLFPYWTALFATGFVLYWFLRTLYLSFHLRAGYRKMQESQKVHWQEKLHSLSPKQYSIPVVHWQNIYHLIVIPANTEPFEILRETLGAIQKSDYPKKKMIVVLSLEEKARASAYKKTALLEKELQGEFLDFLVAFHPVGLPGEIPGKGSNETWAVKIAKTQIIDRLRIPYSRILITSLDADTIVFPQYFSAVTYHYLTAKDPLRISFQPVPLFINNIWQAPAFSRIFAFSTTFWNMMNQERPEKLLTFSSHSMSFQTLVDIGYKQTNVVCDDSRIFWQCFLRFDGNYRVQPLYYPVSMDANVGPTFWSALGNIYKQQRRWAYGVADIPYFLFGFLKNKAIPLSKKISLGWELIEGHWSWASASLLILLLGWLPLTLGRGEFSQSLLSYNFSRLNSRILTVSLIGVLWSGYLSMFLLPSKPLGYGRFRPFLMVLQWILLPPAMVFFSLPAIEAQTRLMLGKYMGFWHTPKLRNSKK